MAECNTVDKSLLEKIQAELEGDPELYDVTFSVGPQKTKVKALKIILLAASAVLKNEFKTKWNAACGKNGNGKGIPLPDFDGKSFHLFVKLTSLDAWSLKALQKRHLQPHHIFNLLKICRHYDMQTAVQSLEQLKTEFIQSFAKFKDTDDFLRLSQAHLKEVLASNDLPLEEMEVYKCALRWAKWKCKENKIAASAENLRQTLGNCLFEIRFPIMSAEKFAKVLEQKHLLTKEEILEIYTYIESDENGRRNCGKKKLSFKTRKRNNQCSLFQKELPVSVPQCAQCGVQLQHQTAPCAQCGVPVQHETAPCARAVPKAPACNVKPGGCGPCGQLATAPATPKSTCKPLGSSTLSLLSNCRRIDAKTPFVCNGRVHRHDFETKSKIAVVGLGFAGPINSDAVYEVTVDIKQQFGKSYSCGTIKKHIVALKGRTFYFLFDTPITVEPGVFGSVEYSLKGPCTASIVGEHFKSTTLQEGCNQFVWGFQSNQLSEMLFKRL